MPSEESPFKSERESLNHAFTVWISQVLLPARMPGVVIPEVKNLKELDIMMSENIPIWTEEWRQKGLKEGIEAGLQQGFLQGGEAMLRRQLLRRFGPLPEWADTGLSEAGLTQLEVWCDRILEARTLEDVLGSAPPDSEASPPE